MKKLKEILTGITESKLGLYVSLTGTSQLVKEKLANLKGYPINECDCSCDCDCGCGCDCDCKCSDGCDPCCNTSLSGTCINTTGVPMTTNKLSLTFMNDGEILRLLDSQPKVDTIRGIYNNKFYKYCFTEDPERAIEPMYIGSKDYTIKSVVNRENGDMPNNIANPDEDIKSYDVATIQNKKIYKATKEICDEFDLVCPIIETKINGEVQVYTIINLGTNGKEGSIKSSLEDVAQILNSLDKRSDIKWSQVLDVAIDNIDDLYYFLITFTFEPDKVRETIKNETIK